MYCQVLPGQNSSAAVPVVASNSLDTAIDYDNDSEDYVIIDNPLGSGGECRRDIYCIYYLHYLLPSHFIFIYFMTRRDYHCQGRERCVRRRGRFM